MDTLFKLKLHETVIIFLRSLQNDTIKSGVEEENV